MKINGEEFNVGVANPLNRSLRALEKYRVTTEDGKTHREVQAVYRDFQFEIGNFGRAEYDRLIALLASGDEMRLEVDGKEYVGVFDGIADEAITEDEDGLWWDNLTLDFTATVPLEV